MRTLKQITVFIVLSLVSINNVYSQQSNNKLDCLQGIWNFEEYDGKMMSFRIVKYNKFLSFGYEKNTLNYKFPLNVYLITFESTKEIDSLDIKSLKESGKYYIEFPENATIYRQHFVKDFYIPLSFGCEEDILTVLGAKLSEYRKFNYLPINTLMLLKQRGEIDKRNYIKEFIDKPCIKIKVEKAYIHNSSMSITKNFVKKGEILEFIKDKGPLIQTKNLQSGSIFFLRSVDIE